MQVLNLICQVCIHLSHVFSECEGMGVMVFKIQIFHQALLALSTSIGNGGLNDAFCQQNEKSLLQLMQEN